MALNRRKFIFSSVAAGVAGSLGSVVAQAGQRHGFHHRDDQSDSIKHRGAMSCDSRGYGDLIPDPNGLLDLPKGFSYTVFSQEGQLMSDGSTVPSSHDGMAAFSAGRGKTVLIRNHELKPDDIIEDGLFGVSQDSAPVYDPLGAGGTTTLLVNHKGELIEDHVSLAGTADNCAGGVTPWQTWLTCEEDDGFGSKPHGYVFEVSPRTGGNPEPIIAMGRFEHEAVSFDRDGTAYLTEDASGPFGCFYRFIPDFPFGGPGSLHAGGTLQAMVVNDLDNDLSAVQTPGMLMNVSWIDVPNVDPNLEAGDDTVRVQVQALGATPIRKAEGTWVGQDGSIWFVGSYADGPEAEDEEDRTAAVHAGQIWRYDPFNETIELVAIFPKGTPYDSPDNITVGPYGFAVACTDGDADQWLIGITEDGYVFPIGKNAENEEEFAGATFSADGDYLFVNVQGPPGRTYAIKGPWRRG